MIDAHQHFWRYSSATHGWIDARMAVLKRDFLPKDLEPLMRANGVEGCIAVQAAQTAEETRFLLQLADEHAFIRGVVGWIDLRVADNARGRALDAQLEQLVMHPRFKGVRHLAQDEPDDRFLVRDDVVRGISRLGRFDLTYDVLVYARQLPAAIELCRSLPNQRFVLDHLGKPEVHAGKREPWAAHMRELAACDNVACKLSGLVTEADWKRWKYNDLAFYLDTAIEAFGPARLMIGSDWPVCLLAASYVDALAVGRDAIAALSADERAAISVGNALDWYRS
jgi:L-fucono-1,5-lactonase